MTTPIENLEWLIDCTNSWLEEHPQFASHQSTKDLRDLLNSRWSNMSNKLKRIKIGQIEYELRKINLAYHEAGHAVAFYFLTNPQEIQDISIEFNEDQTNQVSSKLGVGRVHVTPDDWPHYDRDISNQKIHDDMLITYAGFLAQPDFKAIEFLDGEINDKEYIQLHMGRIGYTIDNVKKETKIFLDKKEVKDSVELIAIQGYASMKTGKNAVSYSEIFNLLSPIASRP